MSESASGHPERAQGNPAHFVVVDRIFDQRGAWRRIDQRLQRYPAIARHFPIDLLRQGHGRPPYGVHYMAWRLGVWDGEVNFEVLDGLLAHAASLPGWSGEASLLSSADFGQYWSLVWQLQVARLLSDQCTDVCWATGGAGPDLLATIDGQDIAVECYCYHKKFGDVEFLRDVFMHFDRQIRVEHNLCIPITYKGCRDHFLDRVMQPFLDGQALADARREALRRWPVDLPLPAETANLRLYVEGDDIANCMPSLEWGVAGDPEDYLKVALEEATRAKAGKNRLAAYANNLVAINMLLTSDFQMSIQRQQQLGLALDAPSLPADIHVATVSACGIDQAKANCLLGFTNRPTHPGLRVFGL